MVLVFVLISIIIKNNLMGGLVKIPSSGTRSVSSTSLIQLLFIKYIFIIIPSVISLLNHMEVVINPEI